MVVTMVMVHLPTFEVILPLKMQIDAPGVEAVAHKVL
jgi:hypothetical protein